MFILLVEYGLVHRGDCINYCETCHFCGGGDSSVVRAPDSWLKGRGFESLLERRENFLLQGRLSVLLFRYPFHPRVTTVARKKSRSFCQKCRWQVTAKTRTHLTYVDFIEPCFGIGHNLSLICQMTSEDIKHQLIISVLIRLLYGRVLGAQTFTPPACKPFPGICACTRPGPVRVRCGN